MVFVHRFFGAATCCDNVNRVKGARRGAVGCSNSSVLPKPLLCHGRAWAQLEKLIYAEKNLAGLFYAFPNLVARTICSLS